MPAPGANEDPQCTSGHAPGLYEHGMLRPLQLAAYGRAQGAGGTLACARMLVYKSGRARARALAGVDGQARGGRGVKPSVPVVTRWLASSDFTYAAIRVIHACARGACGSTPGPLPCFMARRPHQQEIESVRRTRVCQPFTMALQAMGKLVHRRSHLPCLCAWSASAESGQTGAARGRAHCDGAVRALLAAGLVEQVPRCARSCTPGKQGGASMLRWWSAAGDSDRHATSVKGRPGSWCARRRAGLVLCLGRSAVRNETWSAAAHMSTNATAVT